MFFIIPFSGFYITKLTISPIYIFSIIGIYLFFILIIENYSFKFDITVVFASIFFLYLFISQLFLSPIVSTYINEIFSVFIFIVVYFLINKSETSKIIYFSEKLIFFSIPLLIYEALYRIIHPVMFVDFVKLGRKELQFYYYKMNSIMYLDSNFVGLYIISLYFYLLYLKGITNKKYTVTTIILIFLTLLTISRASIIVLFVFSFLYSFKKYILKYKKMLSLLFLICLIYLYNVIKEISIIDDSFSSKFYIIKRTLEYLSDIDYYNLFFGVGCGNTVKVLGIGAHNFLVTYLIENGIFGIFLLFSFWFHILKKTKYKAGIIMFPFITNGFSLTTTAIPYLYIMFASITVIESRRNKNV